MSDFPGACWPASDFDRAITAFHRHAFAALLAGEAPLVAELAEAANRDTDASVPGGGAGSLERARPVGLRRPVASGRSEYQLVVDCVPRGVGGQGSALRCSSSTARRMQPCATRRYRRAVSFARAWPLSPIPSLVLTSASVGRSRSARVSTHRESHRSY